jgi:hypothetical protein
MGLSAQCTVASDADRIVQSTEIVQRVGEESSLPAGQAARVSRKASAGWLRWNRAHRLTMNLIEIALAVAVGDPTRRSGLPSMVRTKVVGLGLWAKRPAPAAVQVLEA